MRTWAFAIFLLACSEQKGPGPNAQALVPKTPASAASAASAPPSAEPAAPATVSVEAGKSLYIRICANCHGMDGTGEQMRKMWPTIGDLTSGEMHGRLDDAALALQITNGKNQMPGFGTMLKPEEVKSVVAYVRTLKK